MTLDHEVQPHRDYLQQMGGKLLEIEQLLRSSRDLQLPLNDNVTSVISELTKLSVQEQKLSQDRDNTESYSAMKEIVCCYLKCKKAMIKRNVKSCKRLLMTKREKLND